MGERGIKMNRRIYLTIDIECHDIKKRNLYIDGKYKKDACGLEYILKLAKENDIPVNCFLDIPEMNEYGKRYIEELIDLIHQYGQNIYLHLHPDYITKDKSRSFLWQYSYDEKKEILKSGFSLFHELLGHDVNCFRIGRYGADFEMYKAIDELGYSVTDLSYCSNCPKMCHVNKKEIGVDNKNTTYYNQLIVPNTRYLGLKLRKRKVYINFDASDTTLNEFKRIIDNTKLDQLVFTMHSWNFIKKYFFLQKFCTLNRIQEKKFLKMISYARENNFRFCDLTETPPEVNEEQVDENIDLCDSISNRIMMIINNFIRFGGIARLNKKYFIVYAAFFCLCLLIIAIIIFALI